MAYDHQKSRAAVRRIVHDTFAVSALYKGASMTAPIAIRARHHDKTMPLGDLGNGGYAMTIEGVDRIIFDAVEARTIGVERGGHVWFPKVGSGLGVALGSPFGGENIGPPDFILHVRVPNTGPITEIWEVTRK